jgi:Tfp pilus assembly protein PilX
MSTRLAAEQERACRAHDRLTEATTGHAAEIELTGRQAQQRIAAAQTERDTAVQAAETARDAALTEVQERGQEAWQAAQRAAVAKATASGKTPPANSTSCAPAPPPSWTGSAPTPPASGKNSASSCRTRPVISPRHGTHSTAGCCPGAEDADVGGSPPAAGSWSPARRSTPG